MGMKVFYFVVVVDMLSIGCLLSYELCVYNCYGIEMQFQILCCRLISACYVLIMYLGFARLFPLAFAVVNKETDDN